jgi:hypothetical protein
MTICEVGSSGSACADASYVVTDSEGNILYNGNIASGTSENIELEDTTINFVVNGTTTSTTFPTLSDQIINIVWQ